MSKKEEFKAFVASKPELASFVKNGTKTWQDFYELYNLYGESSSVWDEYNNRKIDVSKISDLIKNVDVNKVKEHINTAQKALDVVEELTSKVPSDAAKAVKPLKPITKFFED